MQYRRDVFEQPPRPSQWPPAINAIFAGLCVARSNLQKAVVHKQQTLCGFVPKRQSTDPLQTRLGSKFKTRCGSLEYSRELPSARDTKFQIKTGCQPASCLMDRKAFRRLVGPPPTSGPQ